MTASLKEYIDILLQEEFLKESKQNIINLGFPPVVASLLFEKYGNKAFTVAKWFKDYHWRGVGPEERWWINASPGGSRKPDLSDFIYLWQQAQVALDSGDPKVYLAARRELGLHLDPNYWNATRDRTFEEILANLDLVKEVKSNIASIRESFFDDVFFHSVFMKDFTSGKISDVKPYSKLGYQQSQDKYDKKRIFADQEPLKTYPDGWKWINVGPKCQLIGGLMKNCGSTGVMSWDENKTMLVLFDPRNKPHVVTTYSPTQKRLSGAEGVGSSVPKEAYENYILDLASTLGIRYDAEKSNSPSLRIKTAFGPHFKSMMALDTNSAYSPESVTYKIMLNDGQIWYGSGTNFISQEDVLKAAQEERVDVSTLDSLHGFARKTLNSYDYPRIYISTIISRFNPEQAIDSTDRSL